jgi:methionine-rich copper-binding protein CopC
MKHMKTSTILTAFILISFFASAQNVCPTSLKRNNGNGTCNGLGELRLTFPSMNTINAPFIDSIYIGGVKKNVTFDAPETSRANKPNGYISYCITSGNMPPVCLWTIFFHSADGGSYTCNVYGDLTAPLAVTYYSFDASVTNNTVTCKWITATEINNNYFELERSFDGVNYNTVAMIFGAENNTTSQETYMYKDNAATLKNNNIAYYRIKQVDKDGSANYSKIVIAKLKAETSSALKLSPNPFTDNITIKIESAESGAATTKIMNATGQTVVTEKTNVTKGANNIQVANLSNLSKGMYVVQVSINGVVTGNQKIIKN